MSYRHTLNHDCVFMTGGKSYNERQEEGHLLRRRQLQVLVTARGHHLSSREGSALTYRINSYLHLPTPAYKDLSSCWPICPYSDQDQALLGTIPNQSQILSCPSLCPMFAVYHLFGFNQMSTQLQQIL